MANGTANADYIIGNEVAFDDIAAFNAAMQSPVRQELAGIFTNFHGSGRNTHFPMLRGRTGSAEAVDRLAAAHVAPARCCGTRHGVIFKLQG